MQQIGFALSGGHKRRYNQYFTDFTYTKGLFYGFVIVLVFTMGTVSVLAPMLLPSSCFQYSLPNVYNGNEIEFGNSLYKYNPCRFRRFFRLLLLTPDECSYARRLMGAVVLGGIIGWERRTADRPAGIRTMALVCLGSSLFTVCSTFAFLDGPMSWDSSRISAAIPSGVGFLGAGLIFKQADKDEKTGEINHVVHGLTTSASVWVAAAVGVACGGEMYVPAIFCVGVMVLLLRFGPRMTDVEEEQDEEEQDDDIVEEMKQHVTYSSSAAASLKVSRGDAGSHGALDEASETSSLIPGASQLQQEMRSTTRSSTRSRKNTEQQQKRAQLSTAV